MMVPCWRPSQDEDGGVEGLMWYKDLGYHTWGQFSMAVIQANSTLEDQSQLESGFLSSNESGPSGTFVGIYDGHGGPEASRFVNNHLFTNMQRIVAENGSISEHVIRKAFSATEESFLSAVKKQWLTKPQIASAGTCCLVGVVCNGLLYVANVGDSRLVLGKLERPTREVMAVQLSTEHNVSLESVRQEIKTTHANDPQIVVLRHNVWRVKGLIQVSRSIGDAYLKKPEFNREPLLHKFRLPDPAFRKPILSSHPSISVFKLRREDQFLIFASDGLWEHLSNQEAVDIVGNNPRRGIARKLIEAALQVAARKREMRLADLKKNEPGVRRHFHDDISVVVVFLDQSLEKWNLSSHIKYFSGAQPLNQAESLTLEVAECPAPSYLHEHSKTAESRFRFHRASSFM